MKEISIDGCEIIGTGAFGKVYRIDADTIVKVYDDPAKLPMIETEQARSRRAFIKGIPTAIPFGVAKVGESYGSLFELINARNCNDFIISHPEKTDSIIAEYAGLITRLNAIQSEPGEFPSSRQVLLDRLDLIRDKIPADVYAGLADYVAAIPESYGLVHGDIQMKNVMLSGDEMLLIDMESMSAGNIAFELAGLFMTYIAFYKYSPEANEKFLGIDYKIAKKIYGDTVRLCGCEDTRRMIEILGWLKYLAVIIIDLPGRADWTIAPTAERIRNML